MIVHCIVVFHRIHLLTKELQRLRTIPMILLYNSTNCNSRCICGIQKRWLKSGCTNTGAFMRAVFRPSNVD